MGKVTLEAPVFSVEAALEAADFGIDRLELCANFPEGGETPSAGMLKFLRSEIDIPIFVMIRPRGGDFAYSQKELMVMKRDIELLGELGADGFVFGVLDTEGEVNTAACESLIRTASGKPCTFHRAFDALSNQFDSLETIISLGFDRILTSGGKNSVSEGFSRIQDLMEIAQDRISIMPGGGSKPEHVTSLSKIPYFKDIHASCKTWKSANNNFVNPDVSFSDDPEAFSKHLLVDQETVSQFREAIDSL
ncbi:copper homeostasis protein CutC [Algoriphagus machipongonensis]|uniref:PF03932 family protein CutC n=1 Tax=Algoriphagus machipongonensis TaxID=388413 RepID=A3HZD5_9BACT|nr:copper homeostasis protein CutC [Algoriphagus machipongonensis]EAZ80621.1 copper homeostasis protein CutC [Algoriphagus machipongonensis]